MRTTEAERSGTRVTVTVRGCRVEPCRIVIGLSCGASEPEIRKAVKERLRQHLAEDGGGL